MRTNILTAVFFSGALWSAVPGRAAAAPDAAPAQTVDQAYRPSNTRDPLMISTVFGDEHAPRGRAGAKDISKSTFSVYNLLLTGVLEDSRSREAMLSDRETGAVYILKGGRLLDSGRRQIPGVSGVIKGKQVILMTDDKKVHQLNLHEKD